MEAVPTVDIHKFWCFSEGAQRQFFLMFSFSRVQTIDCQHMKSFILHCYHAVLTGENKESLGTERFQDIFRYWLGDRHKKSWKVP